ncbi:MAG: dNTP triphosphohydrolase [Bacteroidales bacterium]|nr:dNTP triphosphohydrolase [Bacteroidales bacterium]
MNYKEKWDLLLGEKRFRPKSETIETDARNSFDRDYSKLVFSAPVRRLQGKTQVFPLPDDDYPRTRLTHSMEVSFLGGSIGRSIESILMGKDEISQECFGYLPSLLRVAGLVHDLGNTPFGHFGEKAIGDFFKSFFENNPGCGLSSIEKADLENFDGNVQTFRILTKLHYFGDNLSYNLSYQTLSSVLKYPVDSLTGNKGKSAKSISYKKFGYFQSEVEEFSKRKKITCFILEAHLCGYR